MTYTTDDIVRSLKGLEPGQAFTLELGKNVENLKWDYTPIIYDRELNLGFKPQMVTDVSAGTLTIYREKV